MTVAVGGVATASVVHGIGRLLPEADVAVEGGKC